MEGTWIEKKFDISSNNDSEFLSGGETSTRQSIPSYPNDLEFFEHLAFLSRKYSLTATIVQFVAKSYNTAS